MLDEKNVSCDKRVYAKKIISFLEIALPGK